MLISLRKLEQGAICEELENYNTETIYKRSFEYMFTYFKFMATEMSDYEFEIIYSILQFLFEFIKELVYDKKVTQMN